jgi:hypothetical protein
MSAKADEMMGTGREAIGLAIRPLPVTAHLLEPVIARADRDPGWAVAASRDGDRSVDVTAGEFSQRVRRLAPDGHVAPTLNGLASAFHATPAVASRPSAICVVT